MNYFKFLASVEKMQKEIWTELWTGIGYWTLVEAILWHLEEGREGKRGEEEEEENDNDGDDDGGSGGGGSRVSIAMIHVLVICRFSWFNIVHICL